MNNGLPPGLAGYVLAQQQAGQNQMQQLQGLTGLAQLQAHLAEQQMIPAKMDLLKAQAAKAQSEADFSKNITALGDLNRLTPEALETLALKAGPNHAAGLFKIAELRRAQDQNARSIGSMQATPGVTPATPNDDEGNPLPTTPATPGATAFLMNSPFPGIVNHAKQIQAQIDSGAIRDPKDAQNRIDQLAKMHEIGMNQMTARQDNAANAAIARQDNAATRMDALRLAASLRTPPAPEALESVIGPDGKPTLVPRSQAIGKTPASRAGGADSLMDAETIDNQARMALYDRSVLQGWSRTPQLRAAIEQRMTQVMKESGIGPNDVISGRAGFKADSTSLNKLTPQYDAVTAFEKTAIRNGDRLMELADKVDTTGIPVIEKWVRAGRQATGDPDVAKFNAQLQVYRTEAAKILTNPNLTGQLTDSARKEVEAFMQPGASPAQIKGVVQLLKNDFENRKATLEEQIGAIRNRMKGRMVGPSSEGSQPTATAPSAAPVTNAKGWVLHTDKNGNKAYVSPDGKQVEEVR